MFRLTVLFSLLAAVTASSGILQFNFNAYETGPIEGQFGWTTYEKVPDSSALSIMDSVGTTEEEGDKALLVQQKGSAAIRCVHEEHVRWLPGESLKIQFDFKVGISSREPASVRPVLTVLVGDALLAEDSRWAMSLVSRPDGDWELRADVSGGVSERIYGEDFLIRPNEGPAVSDWHRFVMRINKHDVADSFDAQVEIRDRTGETVAMVELKNLKPEGAVKNMWSLPRAHAGILAARDQLGLAIVDNFVISSSME
jgi:hypothetical protein